MVKITVGKQRRNNRQLRQVAASADGKLLSELNAAERNALLGLLLFRAGLLDKDGRVDLPENLTPRLPLQRLRRRHF